MKTPFSTNLATPSKKRSLAFLLSGLTLALSLNVSAVDLSAQKLFGRWNMNPANFEMGNAHGTLAVSEKWIVVGTPSANEGAPNQGSVQVFNAVTGLWTRKLSYPIAADNNRRLGQSCAIFGDVIAVGAPDVSNATTGSVFIFNATSGKILSTIILPSGEGEIGKAGDQFGTSLAIFGTRLLIGSPAADAGKGRAYIYDYANPTFNPIPLTDTLGLAADGLGTFAGDRFGTSVAVEGNIGIVGSPNMSNELTVKTGGFLAFDMTTGARLKRFTPTGAAAGDTAGSAVALAKGLVIMHATSAASPTTGKVVTYNLLTGEEITLAPSDSAAGDLFGRSISSTQSGLIIIGAPGKNTNQGAAYIYDLNTISSTNTTELMKIPALQNTAQAFGSAVALFGETAIIAASNDSTAGPNVGSVYVIKPITSQMPLKKVAARGDFAPGAESILFNAFSDVCINADSEIAFTSTLTGPGSNAGKDTGIWSTLNPTGLELGNKSRNLSVGGVGTINVLTRALLNTPSRAIYQASLLPVGKSAAITPINNQAIYFGTGTLDFYRTGTTFGTFDTTGLPGANAPDGAVPLGFIQVVQSRTADLLSVTCTLRPNVNGTLPTNDSGLFSSNFATPIETRREGFAAFVSGPTLGQFTGRVAQYDALTVFATAVAGGAPKTQDQAIFSRTFGGATATVSQKGVSPVHNAESTPITGATFASYIGETADATNVLFRATIAGTPASAFPAAENEGLWLYNGNGTIGRQILRKGVNLGASTDNFIPPQGLAGVRIAKFLAFWQTNGQQLALVQLAGTGVTAANDQALLLLQSNPANQLAVLIREGQIAPNCGNATIGVINRVEVEPHRGTYLVLTTLVGAAKGTDLALFQGASSLPVTATTDTLRRPYLVLRKGQLFNNQPSKVKSFSLPANNLTAGGAGATGLGKAIQEGTDSDAINDSVIVVEFDNGVRQIMKGKL